MGVWLIACWLPKKKRPPSGVNTSGAVSRPATSTGSGTISTSTSLHWRYNGRNSVSNHQPDDCLFSRLFRRKSKETSKLRVTGLCAGNSPGTGKFPAQMAGYAENVSIWWRHHDFRLICTCHRECPPNPCRWWPCFVHLHGPLHLYIPQY